MELMLVVFIFGAIKNALLTANETDYFNLTDNTSLSFSDVNTSFSITGSEDNSTAHVPGVTEPGPAESSGTTYFGETGGTTEAGSESPTADVRQVSVTTMTTTTAPTVSPTHPLVVSGALPPALIDVSHVCPCSVLEGQCEINCCCDKDCNEETQLFTQCSTELLVADKQMCSRNTARYSLTSAQDGLMGVSSSIQQEVNPDVFCIQTANFAAGLSFGDIELPTNGNFNSLFRRFAGFFFLSLWSASTSDDKNLQTTPGYKYGETIQTEDRTRLKGLFRLPAPAGTMHCSDNNPAAFLKDQSTQCIRTLVLSQDCTTQPMLNLKTYVSFNILSVKNYPNQMVAVTTDSISLQSLEGTRVLLASGDSAPYSPVLLELPGSSELVCNNVVLQVRYVLTYSEVGAVLRCAASFVLGPINSSMLPLQQDFHIVFVQENGTEVPLPFSGNPGYVVGLPLVAGSMTTDGIVQSASRAGTLTTLQSSITQDCLGKAAPRAPVLFGLNVASGCTLRLVDTGNCTAVSEALLTVLRGQDLIQYVASFGNSKPQMVMDWVPIRYETTPTITQGCSIPMSVDMEVRWTKYGSLVNPQAQIVNVTNVIRTNTSGLNSLASSNGLVFISSSVTFVDASAPAQPGYKAPPTINAKLPFDFFFPFV